MNAYTIFIFPVFFIGLGAEGFPEQRLGPPPTPSDWQFPRQGWCSFLPLSLCHPPPTRPVDGGSSGCVSLLCPVQWLPGGRRTLRPRGCPVLPQGTPLLLLLSVDDYLSLLSLRVNRSIAVQEEDDREAVKPEPICICNC